MRNPQSVDFLKWLVLLLIASAMTVTLILMCLAGDLGWAGPVTGFTSTSMPSLTLLPTRTSPPTATQSPTPTPTPTRVATAAATHNHTSAPTRTSTTASTPTPTLTSTRTSVPTYTPAHTPTWTPTVTYTPSSTSTATPLPWLEIINRGDGYAITVPGAWQSLTSAQDPDAISALLADQSPDLAQALDSATQSGLLTHISFIAVDAESNSLVMVLVGKPLLPLPVGILLNFLMGQLGELEGYTALDTSVRQVSAVTAALTEFTLNVGAGADLVKQRGLQLFVPARQATFVVILVSDEAQFDVVRPVFEEILDSFRLLS
jgi:hypothetical protein